jgi:serine/threonine-protein kinase HipA
LSDDELDAKIEEMPRRPLLTATEGVRLSLAGAQNKLPVFVQDGKIFLPLAASPSSHILKPKIPEFEDTVENEGFCMMLAKECGLPVPEVSIRAGKHRCLLVSRYDRTLLDGRLTRLHQEDFCQALGFSHNEKYQKDGGPGLKQCFDLLEEHSAEPILDKRNLLRGVVFNYLIGNADAHAKNISLLISEEGLRLAPFYDLMSTVVYRKLAKELAMKVGGEDRPDWIAKRHWERIAGEAAVTPKAIIEICAELGEVLPDKTELLAKPFIAEHGAESTVSTIATYSTATSKRLRDGLNSH